MSAVTVDLANNRLGVGTNSPTETLDVTGNTKIGGTLNLGTIGGGSPIINLGLDSSGNVVTGTTGSITYSGVGFSFRQQLTGVNPSPSTTYYSTVVSSSSLFLSSTEFLMNLPSHMIWYKQKRRSALGTYCVCCDHCRLDFIIADYWSAVKAD